MTAPLRLAFMGTPEFAVPALDALVAAGHEIAAVYTQPPRPAGRGHRLTPSPVQAAAARHGLAVRHPERLKDPEEQAAFAALDLDVAVVAAYGLILPRAILDAPRLGCVNIHASLLPRWRGAAPIQRAILEGDAQTGITIMMMAPGLDTGPMLLAEALQIGPDTTAGELHDRLAALGARLIGPALDGLAEGTLTPEPQPEAGVTYAAKITAEDGRMTFADAERELRRVRALAPRPGGWMAHEGERLRVLAVEPAPDAPPGAPGEVVDERLAIACATGGAIRPTRLQRPGRPPHDVDAFLRGHAMPPGTRLA
ncbi:MAG: methionyl-tRNA formyltransferase [Azospirillaceae bacterium]